MIESLFALSIGFLGYIIYALVGEQVGGNVPTATKRQAQSPKPLTAGAKVKATAAAKTKPKTAVKKKTSAKSTTVKPVVVKPIVAKSTPAKKKSEEKPANLPVNPIIAYLEKNGQTSVAKLTRELPDGKEAIQDNISKLLQAGKITQKTIGRAKTISLSS